MVPTTLRRRLAAELIDAAAVLSLVAPVILPELRRSRREWKAKTGAWDPGVPLREPLGGLEGVKSRLAALRVAPRLLPPGVSIAQIPVRVAWRWRHPRQPFDLMLAGLAVVEDE